MEGGWNLRLNLRALLAAVLVVLLVTVVPSASGLRCYQCGLYTDGVGSITPCINYTKELHLKECPKEKNQYCQKFVSEGISVRSCARNCTEQESSWGGSFYCCKEEGCNGAPVRDLAPLLLAAVGVLWLLRLVPRMGAWHF